MLVKETGVTFPWSTGEFERLTSSLGNYIRDKNTGFDSYSEVVNKTIDETQYEETNVPIEAETEEETALN